MYVIGLLWIELRKLKHFVLDGSGHFGYNMLSKTAER